LEFVFVVGVVVVVLVFNKAIADQFGGEHDDFDGLLPLDR